MKLVFKLMGGAMNIIGLFGLPAATVMWAFGKGDWEMIIVCIVLLLVGTVFYNIK